MRFRLLVIAALAAIVPGTADAQFNVAEVSLLVLENQEAGVPTGWTFVVEIDGVGITTATITPPLRDPIAVPGDSTDRELESATFASFAALQGDFPPTNAMNKAAMSNCHSLRFITSTRPTNSSRNGSS